MRPANDMASWDDALLTVQVRTHEGLESVKAIAAIGDWAATPLSWDAEGNSKEGQQRRGVKRGRWVKAHWYSVTCGICNGAQGRASRASVFIMEHGVRSQSKARRVAALQVTQ